MSERAVEIDDRETIVVGGTIAAVVMAGVYALARIGFESQTTDVLRALGLSLFILASPYWLWRALRQRNAFVWTRSQPFLTLALVTFTALASLVAGPLASALGIGLSVLGAMAAALVVFSWVRNGAIRSRLLFTIAATVMATWCAGVMWTSRYKMPLYWETFATTGNVHHDPLYLVSIGNMLRTYGQPSTGLDGVPYTFYHYGSSWLFSRWSDLLSVDLLSFYSLGYAVITLPLFLAAIAMLATVVRKSSGLRRSPGWLRSNWWGWLALAIATIGIIPEAALYDMAVWNEHTMLSESFLAGLPIFLMACATSIVAWRAERRSPWFLFGFLPLMLAALGFMKVSLMVLFFALILYAVVRTGGWRSLTFGTAVVVMTAVCYLTYKAVALPAHNGGIFPFHFMLTSTPPGWHQFFPLIHLAWTWIYLLGRLYEESIRDMRSLWGAIRSRSILDVELLVGLAVLGFLPGEILYIHGGSAIYFSDVQRWVAIALVIARADHWVYLWRTRRETRMPQPRWMRLSTLLALFIAAPFAVTMLVNTIKPPLRLLRLNLITRTELVAEAGREPELAAGNRGLLFDAATLDSGFRRGQYYAIISALREIQRMPADEKREMLIFVPQSYKQFWRILDTDGRCTYVGLIVPAISEVALLDGMPEYGCDITDQYNMQLYTPRDHEQTALEVTVTALCAKAEAKGFDRILVFEPDESGIPGRRIIDCSSGRAPAT